MRDALSIQGHELESGEPDIYVPELHHEAAQLAREFEALEDRLDLAAALLGMPAHIFDSPRGNYADSAADRAYWDRGLDRIRRDMGLDL